MSITNVNCLHILASFPTMENDPVDYRTDAAFKGPCYPLTAKSCNNVD